MRTGKFWRKNEREVLTKLGFKPVPSSGSGWVDKEDGENEYAISQLKSTEKESYRISLLDLEKLEYHAMVSHKIPIFIIQFLRKETYVLVNVRDFDKLGNISLGSGSDINTPFSLSDLSNTSRQDVGKSKYKPEPKIKTADVERKEFYKEREENWKSRDQKRR